MSADSSTNAVWRTTGVRVVRIAAPAALLAGSLWLLATPELALTIAPRGWSSVSAASLAIAGAIWLLTLLWPDTDDRDDRGRWPTVAFALVLAATLAGTAIIFSRWVDRLVLFAIDPTKGDMLVEITLAIDRLSTGQDPVLRLSRAVGSATHLRPVVVGLVRHTARVAAPTRG